MSHILNSVGEASRFSVAMSKLAVPAFFLTGLAVLLGFVEVTGAPPSGALSHVPLGAIVAVIAESLHGALTPILFALEWLAVIALPIALFGAIRRRAPWSAIPVALVIGAASFLSLKVLEAVAVWLGGVSNLDVAAFWAWFAAMAVGAVGQFPGWVSSFWRWTNSPRAL